MLWMFEWMNLVSASVLAHGLGLVTLDEFRLVITIVASAIAAGLLNTLRRVMPRSSGRAQERFRAWGSKRKRVAAAIAVGYGVASYAALMFVGFRFDV